MKALITSFNAKLGLNPMVDRLFHDMPEIQRATPADCDVVFLSVIAPEGDFRPDTAALDAIERRGNLPVIIFDHEEVFGHNWMLTEHGFAPGSVMEQLGRVVSKMNVKAYFKRELSFTGIARPFPVYPLDWTLSPMYFPGPAPIDSLEKFEKRPIDVFMSWGYSNESRPQIMGELLKRAGSFNAPFCLTPEDLEDALREGRERIFALLFTPHNRRIHISKLLEWQAQSKIAISMYGAGKKCFRSAEASYNAVMAHQGPETVQWSYPWVDEVNCIGLPSTQGPTFWVDKLYEYLRLQQGRLYPMYLAGMQNNGNYRNANYTRGYLLPKILKALA